MPKYTGLVTSSIFLKQNIIIKHKSSKYHPYLVKRYFEKTKKKQKKNKKIN